MRLCFLFTYFVLTILAPSRANSYEVVIAADEWCPFNCEPNSTMPGYMVEVTRRAFELDNPNHSVTYRILPWQRAISMAKHKSIDGIIGATEKEAEGLHLTTRSLGISDSIFFVQSHSPWRFDDIKNGTDQRVQIGGVKGYDYSTEFDNYALNNPKNIFYVYGENPLIMLINLLKKKKINALIEDGPVFWFKLKELGIDSHLFKSAGSTGEPSNVYVAFNQKIYADILDKGIAKIRTSGELEKILNKYNLTDWEKQAKPSTASTSFHQKSLKPQPL